jgi:hypothetical protein
MTERMMTLAAVEQLCLRSLTAAGASEDNAAAVARSTMLAERDGIRSHGLLYVPIYAEHVRCGKVDGKARPIVSQPRPGAVVVDAATGFAHPAIDAGWDRFVAAARQNGIAAMTVFNSYNCGVLGHHAERIAEAGLLGLCTTHAPASIAPPGGRVPVIGTNPFALGVPDGVGGVALVLDQSASKVAKSEILLRSREGRPIEPGWAIDEHGVATLDPAAALKGSIAAGRRPQGLRRRASGGNSRLLSFGGGSEQGCEPVFRHSGWATENRPVFHRLRHVGLLDGLLSPGGKSPRRHRGASQCPPSRRWPASCAAPHRARGCAGRYRSGGPDRRSLPLKFF